MNRFRLRRSELSTPGWSERMIAKAASSDADLVFLDLEDSVAVPGKASARATVVSALRELDWRPATRAVRVNAPGSPWIEEDVETIATEAAGRVDVLIVPKVVVAEDVHRIDRQLTELERFRPQETPIGLEVLIEDVAALVHIHEIADSSPRIETLIFGSGDMAASQGVRTGLLPEFPGDPWSYHRAQVVIAARAAGLVAVDGPSWSALDDLEAYRWECRIAATLGYAGKWAIHPAQIAPANHAFSPTAGEVAHARRVVAAWDEAGAQGRGAIALDGVMVDAVDLRLAGETLDMHERVAASGTGRGDSVAPDCERLGGRDLCN